VRFFSFGVFEIACLSSQTPTLNDLQGAIRQEIRPIHRQFLVRVMDDFKKGLKTASSQTVVILPITFLKLNHLVWHVLSFNFV